MKPGLIRQQQGRDTVHARVSEGSMASKLNVGLGTCFCGGLETDTLAAEKVIRGHLCAKRPLCRDVALDERMFVEDALWGKAGKPRLGHRARLCPAICRLRLDVP